MLILNIFCITYFLPNLVEVRSSHCHDGSLSVYNVKIETFWTKEKFPKQYPLWRPPAQWSRTVGFTHDGSASLFTEGETVTEGVRKFVETGDSLDLETEIEGKLSEDDDNVNILPVTKGEGSRQSKIFVTGSHNRVSCMTAVIPSPDWFVGVTNVSLCQNNVWVSELTVPLSLYDAGTDNGLTFTSPNWETSPRDPVKMISSQSPNHPAASFYYPDLDSLPVIATYTFTKIEQFSTIDSLKSDKCITNTKNEKHFESRENVTNSHKLAEDNFVTITSFDVTVKHPLTDINSRGGRNKTSGVNNNRNMKQELEGGVSDNNTETENFGNRIMSKAVTENKSQIISQYLTFDPSRKMSQDKIIKQAEQHQQTVKFDFLNANEAGKDNQDYSQILSNEIPASALSGLDNFKNAMDKISNSNNEAWIDFVPVTLVRKIGKTDAENNRTLNTRRNNLVATNRILVANEGRQTSHKMRMQKRKRYRRKKLKSLKRTKQLVGDKLSNLYNVNKKTLYDEIMQSYKDRERLKMKKRFRRKKKMLRQKIRKVVSCSVSEWSEWSSCSVTCGIGERTRARHVVISPSRGGGHCPPLHDMSWCGSAKNCKRSYFDW